jgi:hypothetical protein
MRNILRTITGICEWGQSSPFPARATMYAGGHSFPMVLAMWGIHRHSRISGSTKNPGPQMTVSGFKKLFTQNLGVSQEMQKLTLRKKQQVYMANGLPLSPLDDFEPFYALEIECWKLRQFQGSKLRQFPWD